MSKSKPKLSAPAGYFTCPPAIKAKLCNGAGPGNSRFGWVVPDTIYGLSITEAANIHDWMYVWGTTQRDKEEADTTFLLNMLRIINHGTTRTPALRSVILYLRHRRALKYYEAVEALGDRAFREARKSRPSPMEYINPDC